MDITIRAAREEELTGVGELTARAFLDDGLLTHGTGDPYLAVLRDARRRAEHAEVLVAVDAEGEVLGAVAFVGAGGEYADIAGAGEAEFRMLAVRPEGRGRGVGEALVRECLARARGLGLRAMVLSSQPSMVAAHRLYGRLGFTRTPERDWEPLPGLLLWTFALELP
ncbi:GNAT family N-acetyltransferase [Streptomyces sp. N2-109]|uniref:GNAT family N-acetyltransferase n=1 Tax=Streptomyces gossypii TaxID=2883101 RepID=A0ABT2JVC9_9ACTN|nr:GNAT family N-acetyltransferase [Streptomyces gossypii]MCT2591847.1 GNAT family N-acetyltransferase [Streptomyces gossypii]